MKAVLLRETGEVETVHVEGLESLQEFVGGYIEAMSVGRDDATAYGNDEAKLIGMEANDRATAFIYGDREEAIEREKVARKEWEARGFAVIDASLDDPREPYIAGPVVVTGFDPQTGETTPIPEDLADTLLDEGTVRT
jgi:hypothetical protein